MIENHLPHLHYFYLVAQLGSFTRAAERLRISQSAVSIQIKRLEDKLDVALFARESRRAVRLTAAGVQLLARCQRIFRDVEEGITEITTTEISGTLSLTGTTFFGSNVLVPLLPTLHARFPKLDIRLRLLDDVIDLQHENIDLGIRWGEVRHPGITYEYFLHQCTVIGATPKYLRAHGTPRKPRQLADHTIVTRNPHLTSWRYWIRSLPREERFTPEKIILIDNTFAIFKAVLAHLGVAALPLYALSPCIARKQITLLLRTHGEYGEPFFACYPTLTPKVRVVIDTLKSAILRMYGTRAFFSNPIALPT